MKTITDYNYCEECGCTDEKTIVQLGKDSGSIYDPPPPYFHVCRECLAKAIALIGEQSKPPFQKVRANKMFGGVLSCGIEMLSRK